MKNLFPKKITVMHRTFFDFLEYNAKCCSRYQYLHPSSKFLPWYEVTQFTWGFIFASLWALYIGKPSNRMSQACYVLKFSECESFSWQWDFIKGAKFLELLYYWVYFSLRLYPPVICCWGLGTVLTKRNCKALCKVSRAGGVRRKIPKVKLNEPPSPDVFLFFLFLPFCDLGLGFFLKVVHNNKFQ
jgi:hypothetical protein